MKRLLMLVLGISVSMTVVGSCKTRKNKKPAADLPTIVGNPTPPPQEPSNPDNPSEPEKPNPIPTPTRQPAPTPTPIPPNSPSPNPIPNPAPVPLDRYGDPIIPTTPVMLEPHIILDNGAVRIVPALTAPICSAGVAAYYVPCSNTAGGFNCWEGFQPAGTCGYFICPRW